MAERKTIDAVPDRCSRKQIVQLPKVEFLSSLAIEMMQQRLLSSVDESCS
jgi:hypothetical protein